MSKKEKTKTPSVLSDEELKFCQSTKVGKGSGQIVSLDLNEPIKEPFECPTIFQLLGLSPTKNDEALINAIDKIYNTLTISGNLISKKKRGEHPLTNAGLEKAYENLEPTSINKEDIDNIS